MVNSYTALGEEPQSQIHAREVVAQLPSSVDAELQDPTPRPQIQDISPQEEISQPEPSLEIPFPTDFPSTIIEVTPIPITETQCIKKFEIDGNTAFSEARLQLAIERALEEMVPRRSSQSIDNLCPNGRMLSFAEVLLAPTAITDLYISNDYPTSGALIEAETLLEDGVVPITVLEGRLEDIQISGTERLNSDYISSRLRLAGAEPLNTRRLLQGLQLLQLNPLIENISAELQAGTEPGTSLLLVSVNEFDDTFAVTASLSNSRSPSVGSVRRGIRLREGNLLGLGDTISVGYFNTDGSNELNASYVLPISPENTTLSFAANISENRIVEEQFEVLEIRSDASDYSLSLNHPLFQSPRNQFDVELALSRQYSQTFLGLDDIGPFPLSAGADEEGRTVSSALRFSQTWTQRTPKQGIALRSQFSVGLNNLLGGTTNVDPTLPDNVFLVWQGQGQWARQFGEDSLFLLRGSVQLAADPLLSAERFSLGGRSTVRGYRQEELVTDSGIQASLEVRLPLSFTQVSGNPRDGVLKIAPFIDFGHGWNVNGSNPDTNTLLGIGSGLIWEQTDPDISARLDFGIPLISASGERDSLQESGIYFSIQYSLW